MEHPGWKVKEECRRCIHFGIENGKDMGNDFKSLKLGMNDSIEKEDRQNFYFLNFFRKTCKADLTTKNFIFYDFSLLFKF